MSCRIAKIILMLFLLLSCIAYSSQQQDIYTDIVKNNSKKTKFLIKEILSKKTSPDTIELEIFPGKIIKTLGGEFEKVHIKMKNAHFQNLPVEYAEFTLFNPVIDLYELWDKQKLTLKNNKKVDFIMSISEDALNKFINNKKDAINVDSPHIQLKKDNIILTGKGKILGFNVRFRSNGRFVVRDKHFIDFIPAHLRFNSVPLPKILIKRLLKKINPVLNMYDFPFNLRLEKISIQNKKIVFSAGDHS